VSAEEALKPYVMSFSPAPFIANYGRKHGGRERTREQQDLRKVLGAPALALKAAKFTRNTGLLGQFEAKYNYFPLLHVVFSWNNSGMEANNILLLFVTRRIIPRPLLLECTQINRANMDPSKRPVIYDPPNGPDRLRRLANPLIDTRYNPPFSSVCRTSLLSNSYTNCFNLRELPLLFEDVASLIYSTSWNRFSLPL
jgi:hypothetical protein